MQTKQKLKKFEPPVQVHSFSDHTNITPLKRQHKSLPSNIFRKRAIFSSVLVASAVFPMTVAGPTQRETELVQDQGSYSNSNTIFQDFPGVFSPQIQDIPGVRMSLFRTSQW